MDASKLPDTIRKHPWLAITTTVEDYVAPDYYNRLLKPYRFAGKDDLQMFEAYLRTLEDPIKNALELGPGTGRITEVIERVLHPERISLVDLSPVMIDFLRSRFTDPKYGYTVSDSLEYLAQTKESFDFIYTMWSFSHSIHQLLSREPYEAARQKVHETLRKALTENLLPGGHLYLIHFDTESDEQKILMRQWGRRYPFYSPEHPNPSKIFIDGVLASLQAEGIISVDTQHLVGEPITYSSAEEALEIFMNFHLESHFNEDPEVESIMSELQDYFKDFTDPEGIVRIRPGCYEYKIERRA